MVKYEFEYSDNNYKVRCISNFPMIDKNIRIYLDDLRNPYHIVDVCYVTDDPSLVFAMLESNDAGEDDMVAVQLSHDTIQYILQDCDCCIIGAIIPPESVLCPAYDPLDTVLTNYGLDIPNNPNLEPCDLTFLTDSEINRCV